MYVNSMQRNAKDVSNESRRVFSESNWLAVARQGDLRAAATNKKSLTPLECVSSICVQNGMAGTCYIYICIEILVHYIHDGGMSTRASHGAHSLSSSSSCAERDPNSSRESAR